MLFSMVRQAGNAFIRLDTYIVSECQWLLGWQDERIIARKKEVEIASFNEIILAEVC